jgi:hypothetical protein
MSKTADPLGVAAERIALNAKAAALATAVTAYSGDRNGLADLQGQAAYIADRLNLSSTTVTGTAFAYSGFGIEHVSTT